MPCAQRATFTVLASILSCGGFGRASAIAAIPPPRNLGVHRVRPRSAADSTKALQTDGSTLVAADGLLDAASRWTREPPLFHRALAPPAARVLEAQRSGSDDPPNDRSRANKDGDSILRIYPAEESPKRSVEHVMCRSIHTLFIAVFHGYLLALCLGLIAYICHRCNCLCSQCVSITFFVVLILVSLLFCVAVELYEPCPFATGGPLERAFDGKGDDYPPCLLVVLLVVCVCCCGVLDSCFRIFQGRYGGVSGILREYRRREKEYQAPSCEAERRRAEELRARREKPKLVLTLRVDGCPDGGAAVLTFRTLGGSEAARLAVQPEEPIRELWGKAAAAARAEEWQLCLVPASAAGGKMVGFTDALLDAGKVSDLLVEFGFHSSQSAAACETNV